MLFPAMLLTLATMAEAHPGPHAEALATQLKGRGPGFEARRSRPPPPPPPTEGPAATVYGYWPYWGDDLDTVAWDSLSHIAIFGVELEADGSLSGTHNWTDVAEQAVSLGRTYDVKVHLCLIGFDEEIQGAVLPDPDKRARAIDELVALVEAYDAHGVNVDIESMERDLKPHLVSFVQELNARVGDLFIATPAVDWLGAYDYDELAAASDGLFIMAYGYHYSSGDPGPNSPLTGGDPWSERAIDTTVQDYRDNGTPDDKIIVGLPLYGRDWPSVDSSVPGTATGEGSSVTWTSAIEQGERYGRRWDSVTSTPYTFPEATHQLWYDDHESLEDKIAWSLDQGLQGVGFWALSYEDGDPALWSMVDRLAALPADTDSPGDSAVGDSAVGDSADTDDGGGDPPGHRGAGLAGCGCDTGASLPALVAALLALLTAGHRRRR
jgi:spore germination protein